MGRIFQQDLSGQEKPDEDNEDFIFEIMEAFHSYPRPVF